MPKLQDELATDDQERGRGPQAEGPQKTFCKVSGIGEVGKILLLQYFRADKDGDGEISRQDWYEVMAKAGFEVGM